MPLPNGQEHRCWRHSWVLIPALPWPAVPAAPWELGGCTVVTQRGWCRAYCGDVSIFSVQLTVRDSLLFQLSGFALTTWNNQQIFITFRKYFSTKDCHSCSCYTDNRASPAWTGSVLRKQPVCFFSASSPLFISVVIWRWKYFQIFFFPSCWSFGWTESLNLSSFIIMLSLP